MCRQPHFYHKQFLLLLSVINMYVLDRLDENGGDYDHKI